MRIQLKRAYDTPAVSDGARVLVDRLWPRGVTKSEAALTAWLRDLAPSNELRHWYHARPDDWAEFQTRYLKELRSPSAATALAQLRELTSKHSKVTLVFASRNLERNNALVLKQLLESAKKPAGSRSRNAPATPKRLRAAKS